jgi:hypothetical protein
MGYGTVAAVHQRNQLDQRPLTVIAGHLLAALLGKARGHFQCLHGANELGHIPEVEDEIDGSGRSNTQPGEKNSSN